MNADITRYIEHADQWKTEMEQMRTILLECGLEEEYKWKQPCYSYQGKNVAIIAKFKNYCAISFFKGVFLSDEEKVLEAPGENSRTVRMIKFKDPERNQLNKDLIKRYIFEAIEVEKAGLKVDAPKEEQLVYPEELLAKMEADSKFKQAFENLTPGRKRAYIMFFDQAKQSKTKTDRIHKFEKRILMGKGMNDCVCGHSKRMPNCDGSHKLYE